MSNHIRGKGIPVWGYVPSNVIPEMLGYSIEELQTLAKENLSKAYEMDIKAGGFWQVFLKELDFAIQAATELSSEAFTRFDLYMKAKKEEGDQEIENRLRENWKDKSA